MGHGAATGVEGRGGRSGRVTGGGGGAGVGSGVGR